MIAACWRLESPVSGVTHLSSTSPRFTAPEPSPLPSSTSSSSKKTVVDAPIGISANSFPRLGERLVRGDAVLVADHAPGFHDVPVPANLRASLVRERDGQRQPALAAERGTGLNGVAQVAIPAVSVLGKLL